MLIKKMCSDIMGISGKGEDMAKENLCLCEHISCTAQGDINIEDFNLVIGRKRIIAMIGEDQTAGRILQLIAGIKEISGGRISFPDMKSEEKTGVLTAVQYVPDDIVCYDGLSAKTFLEGVSRHEPGVMEEVERLLGVFGIEAEQELLNMTFEQNRLVAMIQALSRKPELLLLDRPYDMLLPDTYRKLLREVIALYNGGSSIVIAASAFDDVFLPCNEYIFMQQGSVRKRFDRKDLPRPAKVITMAGGSLKSMEKAKLKLLYNKYGNCRFLYRETDMGKLSEQLSKSGCQYFNVEELSMEEEIFADYTRWML